MVVAQNGDQTFLFNSKFDNSADDYVGFYEVYRMPELTADDLAGSWAGIEKRALEKLEDIPLDGLPFSVTRRDGADDDDL